MRRKMEKVLFIKKLLGKFMYYNGDEYNGDWKNDLKDGNGIFLFH